MNKTLKLVTSDPITWSSATVSSKTKPSLLTLSKEVDIPTLNPLIPLNPRIRPVNVVSFLPWYVIISLPIFKRPYVSGNPLVEVTVSVSDVLSRADVVTVVPNTTSGTKLSTLSYWSKLSIKSVAPPWNSWER